MQPLANAGSSFGSGFGGLVHKNQIQASYVFVISDSLLQNERCSKGPDPMYYVGSFATPHNRCYFYGQVIVRSFLTEHRIRNQQVETLVAWLLLTMPVVTFRVRSLLHLVFRCIESEVAKMKDRRKPNL